MIIAFLKFILIVFFCIFIIAGVFAVRLLRSFRNLSDRFKGFQDISGSRNTGSRRHNTGTKENIVIDRRSPEEMKKKIFSKNEGEYVDFEEE